MLHHAGNQRRGYVFDFDPPPLAFVVHTPPQRLVSQHLGSLIDTTELLVQLEIPPPDCQPLPSTSSSASFSFPPLPPSLTAGYTSIRAPRNNAVPGFWRVRMKVRRQHNGDKDASKKKERKKERKEERKKERGRGRYEKECLDLWTDCLAISEGPNLVCWCR